jgi:hypothetical protein
MCQETRSNLQVFKEICVIVFQAFADPLGARRRHAERATSLLVLRVSADPFDARHHRHILSDWKGELAPNRVSKRLRSRFG